MARVASRFRNSSHVVQGPFISLGGNDAEGLLSRLLIMASAFSGGCYVKQDAGQWWGCEEYQTPNGPATACAPLASLR